MIGKVRERIRPIIIFLGLFVASMLYQTGSNRMGTLVAFALIAAMLLCFLLNDKGRLRLGAVSVSLLCFLLITTIVTLLRSELPSYYVKLVAQIVVFILMLGIKRTNTKEEMYLRTIFILSSLFYAVVGIVGVASFGSRYYHSSIILFGTSIDPNFFGIPIVACATLLLHMLLTEKKYRILYAIGYFVLIVAIMYSSSRGSFVAVLIGNVLVIINFILGRNIKMHQKVMSIIAMIVAALFLYQYIQNNFSTAWERLLSIGEEGSDNGRFNLWNRSLSTWAQYPILGGGLYYNFHTYHVATHNTYLQVLSETGLVGFTILAAMVIYMLKKTFRHDRIYGIVLLAVLVQVFFLDAMENRCLWSILCWFAVLPSARHTKNNRLTMRGIR